MIYHGLELEESKLYFLLEMQQEYVHHTEALYIGETIIGAFARMFSSPHFVCHSVVSSPHSLCVCVCVCVCLSVCHCQTANDNSKIIKHISRKICVTNSQHCYITR